MLNANDYNIEGVRVNSALSEDAVCKALSSLCEEEALLITDLAEEGVAFHLYESNASGGYWSQRLKVLGLGVDKKLSITPGAVVHEMAHRQQYLDRRLSSSNKSGVAGVWDGKEYPTPNTHLEYFLLPWEQGAFRAQQAFLSKRGLRIPATLRMWWLKNSYKGMDRATETHYPVKSGLMLTLMLVALLLPFIGSWSAVALLWWATPGGVRTVKEQQKRLAKSKPPLRGATLRR